MAKSSGNLIKQFDKVDPNPFSEEFDSSDIANRDEGIDALESPEEEPKTEKETVKAEKYFSGEDLEEMAQKGEEEMQAVELLKKFGNKDDEEESSVIKQDDIDEHRISSLYSEELQAEPPDTEELEEILERDETTEEKTDEDDDEYIYFKDRIGRKIKRTKEDLKKQKEYEENLIASLYGPEYDKTDEYRDMLLLENNFNEIFRADKIRPEKKASSDSNLLQSDAIKKEKKFVEITEAPAFKEGKQHGVSTVEINRNAGGEVESIIVQCKCGEETFIQFDYSEEEEQQEIQVEEDRHADEEKEQETAEEQKTEQHAEEEETETGEDEPFESLEQEETGNDDTPEEEPNATEKDEKGKIDKDFEDMFPEEDKD